MFLQKMCISRFFVFVTIVCYTSCLSEFSQLDEISESLDSIITENDKIVKKPRKVDTGFWSWQNYEDGTGFGNREELLITNIEVRQDPNLPESVDNWQFLEHEDGIYFAGSNESTLLFYQFNVENHSASLFANISVKGTINTFKMINVASQSGLSPGKNDIYVILSVKMNNEVYLKWYRLIKNNFLQIWIWNLGKPVKNVEYFNVDGRQKLLLLYESNIYFNQDFAAVEIYDINIDGYFSTLQLCQQLFIPSASYAEVCVSERDRTMISVISRNNVILYEYKDEDVVLCKFKNVQNITTHGLLKSICFESGYVHYFATSGDSSHLFEFHTKDFLLDKKMDKFLFDFGNVNHILSFPVDTYKKEVVLFIQLKNSTVLALCWRGSESFKLISLPSKQFDNFDLSKVTVIPNYGFLVQNKLIKLNFKLKDLPRTKESEIQKMFEIKSFIQDLLERQELAMITTKLSFEQNIIYNIESSRFSNLTEIAVGNLTLDKIDGSIIEVGKDNGTFEELRSTFEKVTESMTNLEIKIDEIERNIKQRMVLKSKVDQTHFDEVNITGKVSIKGKLEVKNLTIDRLNDIPMNTLMNECMRNGSTKITGLKSYPAINVTEKHFKVKMINGIPLHEIVFQDNIVDYSGIDLSNVTKLEIAGGLNFTKISGMDWQKLMKNVVLKNEKKIMSGTTIISGQVTAHYILMDYLNGLKYPSDYVVKSGPVKAEVTGVKYFDSIIVSDLVNVKSINGVDADEFIYLNKDQNLSNQITFENLIIEESLKIDGKIIGLTEEDVDPELNLLNSNVVQASAKFSNLYVTGKVYVENLINGTEWSELDDLILNDEENVTVTGKKVFLDNVHITGDLEIKTGMIGEHHVSDFITLDTEQELPNLTKMSGNVTFGKVSYEELMNFEKTINSSIDEKGLPVCLKKIIIFSKPPIIDEFSASYINENKTGTEFSKKFDSLLENAHFEHLKVKKLIVDDLQPISINGVNYQKFKNRKISKTGYQGISGDVGIKYLEVGQLYADSVNGRDVEEIEYTISQINSLYEDVFSGRARVESLNVTGTVVARIVNDRDLYEDLGVDNIDTYIFKTNATIENIIVGGLVSGLNFTEKVLDCVSKSEDNVIIEGPKKIRKLKARNLQVEYINGHSVDDIVSSRKNQTLTGPVKIKGSLKVSTNFNSTSTINEIPYHEIGGVIRKLKDNSYKLTGDFVVYNHTYVKDLNVFGLVQNKNMEKFLENLIYLDEKEVVVTGAKLFNDSVDFVGGVTITKNLNDIDLESFYEKAVLIDRPINMNSSVTFKDNIIVENDMSVSNFRTKAINNASFDELLGSAKYLDRPMSVIGNLTLSNVRFTSDISVDSWNDFKMDSLITLHTDQLIPGTFECTQVTANDVEIQGFVNGKNLTEMYADTFMLSSDQNITGKIAFMNNVYVKGDFNSRYINNLDMTKAVTLSGDDPLIGNYVFHHPVVINGDLEVRGKVDGIDIRKWESRAIKNSSPSKQIIYGNLTVHGNVRFERDVQGSGLLNGVDMRKLADDIAREKEQTEAYVSHEKKTLKDKCERLHKLNEAIDKSIYKFKSFDYLRVLEFDRQIFSVHHFEFNDVDYVIVNFETCHADVYSYAKGDFARSLEIVDFGIVKKYITLAYEGNLYFVTLGRADCGRNNSGNIWVLENDRFKHVFDLGNATDIQELGSDAFAVVIDEQVQEWSVKDVRENKFVPELTVPVEEKNVRFFVNDNDTLLASRDTIYGLNVSGRSQLLEFEEYDNPFGTSEILSFRAGIRQKEFVLYRDERISEDYVFICNNNLARRKVLQTIPANRPNSFAILNIEGSYETLLIFAENKRKIQIYEYRGIEGFKHRSSIKIKLDKLFSFKLRTHPYFVKKHCLAVVQDNKLSILVAKMYGDKLDASDQLDCNGFLN